ncbi:MAG: PKD domain-containing protein [Spartobacteria bacterium]|nr:PKD domain-containing protein [Spartobacteria bacterium]
MNIKMGGRLFASYLLVLLWCLLSSSRAELVLHYTFEEGLGSNVIDRSSYGNDGLLVNEQPCNWLNGPLGGALYLDGENLTYVRIPDDPSLQLSTGLTFSVFIRCDDVGRDASIIAKENGFGEQSYWFGAKYGHFGMYLDAGSGWSCTEDHGVICEGEWTHLAGTWDGNAVCYYQDGLLIGSNVFTGPLDTTTIFVGLGVNSGHLSAKFKGVIDELRIYDHSLSSSEIEAIYEAGAIHLVPDVDLVLHYTFEEGLGSNVIDRSSYGNDGLLVNETLATWVTNAIGGCVYFDGTTPTYVHVPNSDSMRLTTSATFHAVMRCDNPDSDAPIIAKERSSKESYWFGVYSNRFGSLLSRQSYRWQGGRDHGVICEGQWMQLSATWDGAVIRYYQNGQALNATDEFTGPLCESDAFAAIGINSEHLENKFVGLLDEIRVYNRALTPDEIDAVATACAGNIPLPDQGLSGVIMPEGLRADAYWRVADLEPLEWRGSGATLDYLASGVYTIEFSSVTGWNTPAAQSVAYTECGMAVCLTGLYSVISGISTDLVLHYTFDEGPDSTILDHSTYGNHGVFQNATSANWTNGLVDGAIFFDGINPAYVYVSNSASLSVTEQISFTALVRCDNPDRDAPIIAKEANFFNQSYWFGVYHGHFGTLLDKGTGWTCDRDHGEICPEQWVHIAATWDGMTVQYYQNGHKLSSSDYFVGPIAVNDCFVAIGINSEHLEMKFEGVVDDVRIYKTALTDGQVSALYDMCASNFPVISGSVQCTLSPPEVIAEGAQWKVAGLMDSNWHESGFAYTDLPMGYYTLEFKPVSGWNSPVGYVVSVPACDGGSPAYVGQYRQSTNLPEGLVLYYTFEEGGGSNIIDQSACDNNGQLRNALDSTWTNGPCEGSLFFDGDAPSYVYIPSSPSLQVSEALTFTALVRCDNPQADAPIIAKENSAHESYWFGVYSNGFGSLLSSSPYVWRGSRDNGVLCPETWSHFAATWDGATMRYYQDGCLLREEDTFAGPISINEVFVTIGINSEHLENKFAGVLDEVRMYNRALSPGEIYAIYEQCAQAIPPSSTGLRVRIQPDEVNAAGAMWRVENTSDTNWYASGVLIEDIPEGVYQIAFSNVFGWESPEPVEVAIPCGIHTVPAVYFDLNQPPVAVLNITPTNGVAPLSVTMDFSGTYDPDGNIVKCEIDKIGDGTFEIYVDQPGIVIADYPEAGTYYPQLMVTDAYGEQDTASGVVQVWESSPPVAQLTLDPTSGTAPLSVLISGTGSVAAVHRTIALYEFDVDGDNVYDMLSASGSVTWVYRADGVYLVKLRVTDSMGVQDSCTAVLNVDCVAIPPVVELLAEPDSGDVPLDVEFCAYFVDDGTVEEYRWDFDGDGIVDAVTQTNVSHYLYTQVGTYSPRVTVIDDDGLTDDDSTQVKVNAAQTYKVWISKPKANSMLWGDSISIIGHVAPANNTLYVQFEYKQVSQSEWTLLGTPVYPQPRGYMATWDVTGLVDGEQYNLRAVAFVGTGTVATSPVYTVTVSSATSDEVGRILEANINDKRNKSVRFSKDESISVGINDGTQVFIPAGTVPSNTSMHVILTGMNTNPANGSAECRINVNENRQFTLQGSSRLDKPLELIMPYPDADNDGFVDGTTVPEATLGIHWYDADAGRWRRALNSEVYTEENYVKGMAYHLTEFGLFGNANLLLPANGCTLVSFTSQDTNTCAAANITDGNPISFWRSEATPVTNQVFVYSFSNYMGIIMSDVILQNYGEVETGKTNFSKDFTILTSMDGIAFTPLVKDQLLPTLSPQLFSFNTTTARYVKLQINSGFDPDEWALAEFSIYGTLTNDADADMMADAWEMYHFGTFSHTGTNDLDDDHLTDLQEYLHGGNPNLNDTDGDGQSDYEEWIAGTLLNNAASSFQIEGCHLGAHHAVVLNWLGVSDRLYRIYSSTNLFGVWSDTVVYEVQGDGSVISCTNPVNMLDRQYFKISVQRE